MYIATAYIGTDYTPGEILPDDLDRALLERLIRENPNLKALSLAADKALGIIRLVSVRKAKNRQRAATRKNGKTTKFSVISREHSVTITPDRLEGTKAAISRILGATTLSSSALHLRNRLLHWLSSIPADSST